MNMQHESRKVIVLCLSICIRHTLSHNLKHVKLFYIKKGFESMRQNHYHVQYYRN